VGMRLLAAQAAADRDGVSRMLSSFGDVRRRRWRHPAAFALVAAAVAAGTLLLTVASAFGATTYVVSTPFAVGQASGGVGGPYNVAVDTSATGSAGNVYVTGGTAVNRYAAASAAAGNATPDAQLTGYQAAWGVAVDPANGDVYTTDVFVADTVQKYDSAGTPEPFTIDPLLAGLLPNPTGIAVSPVNGHIFVGEATNSVIYELDASGGYTGNSYATPGPAQSIAVDAAGAVYAATGGTGTVMVAAPGFPYSQISDLGGAVAVAPSSQHVFVSGDGRAAEYDAAGTQVGTSFGVGTLSSGANGIGLDSDATHSYVGDVNANSAFLFNKAVVPDATTGDATSIAATSATLAGHLDPDGGPGASCSFSYGRDPNLVGASTVACAPPGPYAGATDVTASASDLRPASTYYFRITATNSNGSTDGVIKSFVTPSAAPGAITRDVVDRTDTAATLRGTVSAYGLQTTYYFEYGRTSDYGARVPAGTSLAAGSSREPREVAQGISGLEPGTTYHYRVVATNELGSSVGDDRTFTTDAGGPAARAYEMVSPIEKDSVPVDDDFSGFEARVDGNAVIFATRRASYPGAAGTPVLPLNLALRGGDGWTNEPLDPPLLQPGGLLPNGTIGRGVIAMSRDLTRVLVASRRALASGAVEGHSNLYIHDVAAKRYTLVATSPDASPFVNLVNEMTGPHGNQEFYLGGVADLSMVAFVTTAQLTPEAAASGRKLYSWTTDAGLRLEAGSALPGAAELRSAHQVSDDGTRIYFTNFDDQSLYLRDHGVTRLVNLAVANGTVTFKGASPDGRFAMFLANNELYRWDAESGSAELLATNVSDTVETRPATGDAYYTAPANGDVSLHYVHGGASTPIAQIEPYAATFSASPSGRYLAFGSGRKLTTYDNAGRSEVYLYDAQTGQVTCPSCRTDGGAAQGDAQMGHSTQGSSNFDRYFARAVNDEGQVFFDTPDPLVRGDANGERDVYTWVAGRAALITRGTGTSAATFLDATPDGSDVFFVTREHLVEQDDDTTADLYDARINGGFASQSRRDPRAPCSGPDCSEAAAGPVASSPEASQESAAAVPPAQPARKAKISLVSSTVTATTLRLIVHVTERGRIRASGATVATTVRTATRAGTYTLKIPLTKKARASRRARHRVRVAVTVALTPPFSASANVKFSRSLGR
jgi:hypothetical protein